MILDPRSSKTNMSKLFPYCAWGKPERCAYQRKARPPPGPLKWFCWNWLWRQSVISKLCWIAQLQRIMSVRKANSNLTPRNSIIYPKPLNFTSKKQAVTFSYNYLVSPLRSYNSRRSYKSIESNYEVIAVLKRLATSLTEVVTVVITRARGVSCQVN